MVESGNEAPRSRLFLRSSNCNCEGQKLRVIQKNSPEPWQRRINPYPALSFICSEVSSQASTPAMFPAASATPRMIGKPEHEAYAVRYRIAHEADEGVF